jgi:hypothetical protein
LHGIICPSNLGINSIFILGDALVCASNILLLELYCVFLLKLFVIDVHALDHVVVLGYFVLTFLVALVV